MEMDEYVPSKVYPKIRASKEGNFTFSQKIAEKIRSRFCRLRYTHDKKRVVLVFMFTDKQGEDTLKVNRHGRQARVSAPKLIRQLKLEGMETTKYAFLDGVLVVLFER